MSGDHRHQRAVTSDAQLNDADLVLPLFPADRLSECLSGQQTGSKQAQTAHQQGP
jgi:hypothetical protein